MSDTTTTTYDAEKGLRIGDDLYVRMVQVADLREQDINAQQMTPRHFERLKANIGQRGQIESLPYCHQPGGTGVISIISGHHRAKAARAVGLDRIPVIVDEKEMRRSEVVAKQIAHNELHGESDREILARMMGEIDNIDDLLATGLDEEMLPTLGDDAEDTRLALPHVEFDYRTVTLSFLPEQLAEFEDALDAIDRNSEIVAVANREQFEAFSRGLISFAKVREVKSITTAVAVLTRTAAQEVANHEEIEGFKSQGWTALADLLRSPAVPPEAADVIRQALDKYEREEGASDRNLWRALEMWAADYIAGA